MGAPPRRQVYPEGLLFSSQQRAFTLSCPLQLEAMPFDKQTCKWVLGLYSSLASEVTLQWKLDSPALQAWDAPACRSQWVPTGLRQVREPAIA